MKAKQRVIVDRISLIIRGRLPSLEWEVLLEDCPTEPKSEFSIRLQEDVIQSLRETLAAAEIPYLGIPEALIYGHLLLNTSMATKAVHGLEWCFGEA